MTHFSTIYAIMYQRLWCVYRMFVYRYLLCTFLVFMCNELLLYQFLMHSELILLLPAAQRRMKLVYSPYTCCGFAHAFCCCIEEGGAGSCFDWQLHSLTVQRDNGGLQFQAVQGWPRVSPQEWPHTRCPQLRTGRPRGRGGARLGRGSAREQDTEAAEIRSEWTQRSRLAADMQGTVWYHHHPVSPEETRPGSSQYEI